MELCQPLREAVSWNMDIVTDGDGTPVSLFVRLWVEISRAIFHVKHSGRQPLREAVSWNACYHEPQYEQTVSLFVRLWVEMNQSRKNYQTETTSASSWGCELKCSGCARFNGKLSVSLFVRLWVEMNMRVKHEQIPNSQPLREAVSWNMTIRTLLAEILVSLFVRLWVEIYKSLHCRAVHEVSLFVRLWVEISANAFCFGVKSSASSWGCELK